MLLPEADYKWKWITAFDLGLLFLTEGRPKDAIRQFEKSMKCLETSPDKTIPINADSLRLTRTILAYAYFKDRNYVAAARLWSAEAWPASSIQSQDKAQILADVSRLKASIEKQPYLSNPSDLNDLIYYFAILERHNEAIEFIERNALQYEFTAALLYFYAKEQKPDKVDKVFYDFANRTAGSTAFTAVPAKLTSGLLYIRHNMDIRRLGMILDFFPSVIARDPNPSIQGNLDLTSWSDRFHMTEKKRNKFYHK